VGGPSHSHSHAPLTATATHRRRLLVVLVITCLVVLGEVVGSVVSGSFALLADAGHMVTDAAGLATALAASSLASRPATARRTFGWQRAEVLAALANGLLLTVVSVVVLIGGIRRLVVPDDGIRPGLMIVVALVGLAANAVGLVLLRAGKDESLNVRGAYLEVLGDAIGSVAVIVAGVVIAATGFYRADGIASVAIALLILPRAWSLLRDVALVLLEATPPEVDLDVVREHIARVPGVLAVHDLHAWTITSGVRVLSAHVVVTAERMADGGAQDVLARLRTCLAGHFDVDHCTFQLEGPQTASEETSVHD